MEYRQLGNTRLKIPPVIFGTSALGNLFIELPDNTKEQIVRECIENLDAPVVFDSAGKYGAGLALEVLGGNLKKLGVSPQNVIISNKLGWYRTRLNTPEPTFEPGAWIGLKNDAKQRISYNGIMECWEQGNKLLGEQYQPSMVSVHDPDEFLAAAEDEPDRKKRFRRIIAAYKALSDLKKDGKVEAIGVGAKDWKIIRAISAEVGLDWVMFANSMTILKHPTDLLGFMSELYQANIGIINSAVFHAGFLTGGRFFDYVPIEPDCAENIAVFEWRKTFFSICNQFQVMPAQACISFGMTPPGVISIALNTSDPNRVKENVNAVTTKVPPEFWGEMVKNGLVGPDYPYLPVK
jgi:D-threo-aldose 1-dehydrogenase